MMGAKSIEDGLGPSTPPPPPPYSESLQGTQPAVVDAATPGHGRRALGEGWIWLRTLAGLLFLSTTVANLIQHAIIIRETGLIIMLVITAICWLIYFPRALRSAHTRANPNGCVLLVEAVTNLAFILMGLITLAITVIELRDWRRDGTAHTKFAVSTEGNSLKASITMCSYTIVQSLVWLGALFVLYYRNIQNGWKRRLYTPVHSLIRETRPVGHV